MRIESSAVVLHGDQHARQSRAVQESLRVQVPVDAPTGGATLVPPRPQPARAAPPAETDAGLPDAGLNDPNLAFLKTLLEYLTGQQIRLLRLPPAGETPDVADPDRAGPAALRIEFGFREIRSESEQARFAAAGVVRTADGRDIAFRLEVSMQRQWREETVARLRAGEPARPQKDPLVLVYGAAAARLTETKFAFDLDADGEVEAVSFTGPGSAFLALDRNRNGRIDDGSELFGPASGDGFAELAAYDADGNGWIDAADPVFAELRLYEAGPGGEDIVATLAERGVGALFLGSAATPFELRSAANDSLGTVRASGLYLTGRGRAGVLQHVDLTV